MVNLTKTTAKVPIINLNIFDLIYVLLVFMLSILIGTSWLVEPQVESIPLIQQIGLSVLMTTILGTSLVFYFIGVFSKRLSALKIVSPFMLISAAVSIPIWLAYNIFLPLKSSIIESVGMQNVLIQFFGVDIFNWLTHVWMFAVAESILLGLMLYFFTVFSKTTKGSPLLIPIFFIINGFMALLHTGVAMALTPTGIDIGVVLVHQLVAFFILSAFFFFMGTAGAIGAHQVKNQIALNLGLVFWIMLLLIYIAFFFIASKQVRQTAVKEVVHFGV